LNFVLPRQGKQGREREGGGNTWHSERGSQARPRKSAMAPESDSRWGNMSSETLRKQVVMNSGQESVEPLAKRGRQAEIPRKLLRSMRYRMGRHTLTAATRNQFEGSIRAAAGAENRTQHDCEAEEQSVPRSRSRRKRPTTTR
jgi:hypothetical protein